VSVRLPLVGRASTPAASAAPALQLTARVQREPRAVTVCAHDGRGEPFARALAEALRAHALHVVELDGRTGQGAGASPREALAAALAPRDTYAVVSQRVLAVELEGALDIWIGPPPAPPAPEHEHAARRSCQLELRAPSDALARVLATELAPLLASGVAQSAR
jgi:hypothetical protein